MKEVQMFPSRQSSHLTPRPLGFNLRKTNKLTSPFLFSAEGGQLFWPATPTHDFMAQKTHREPRFFFFFRGEVVPVGVSRSGK